MRSLLGRSTRQPARSLAARFIGFTRDGDGRTLDLDFTQGILDPRITFTRASTATFISVGNLTDPTLTIESVGGSAVGNWDDPNIWNIGKSPRDGQVLVTILVGDTITFNDYNTGVLLSTANTNQPRFDHDPTTLAPKGLLIEASATNLLNFSESFATSGGTNNNWADVNLTRTSTNNTDPRGGTTALRITASAGNGTIISSAAIGTSAARTFSVWLRRVTGTGNIEYTQNNGTNWTTQAITSSWVRYTFTHTVDHRVGIRIVTSGDAIELWGAQLETGSGASSYIPTSASQATRALDSCSIPLSSFGFVTTGGTFQVNYRRGEFGTQERSAISTDYAAGRWIGANHLSGSTTAFLGWWDGTGNLNRTTQAAGTNKLAYSFGANTGSGATLTLPVSISVNGSTTNGTFGNGATNGANVPNLANINNLVIGAASSASPHSTANRDFLNNCVSLVRYWPTRLSDAQLTTLTT